MDKMQQLRDIKGIVEVHDTSLWQLLGLIALVLLIVTAAVYFMKRRLRKKRRFRKTAAELAREHIEAIDYDDPKSVAYTFIEDVGRFVDEKRRAEYEAIVRELEPYKYRKSVPQMDAALKEKIKAFIKGIRWEM